MRLGGVSLDGMIRSFLRWWGGELRALAPQRVTSALAGIRRVLELRVAGDTLRVGLRRGERTRALGEVPLLGDDPRTVGRTLENLLHEWRGGYDTLVLLIPGDRALRRRTRLPLAARDTLDEAIGYDIDRQTPFGEDEIYYGAREIGVDRAGGWVEAELEVVRRSDVDPALDAIHAAGLQPDRLEIDAGHGANLLPPEQRRETGRLLPRATAVLALTVLALGGTLAYLPLNDLQRELDTVERHVTAARRAAAEVQSLRDTLDALKAREAQLAERKREEPMALAMLAEVTRALPANSFAVKLSYDREEIALTGFSGKASALIAQLEETPNLSQVKFRSPVTQDNRLNAERFNIEAKVQAAEGES